MRTLFGCSLLVALMALSRPSDAQHAILAEHPLGAVTVGWDASRKQEIRRVAIITLTSTPIINSSARRTSQRYCAKPFLAGWAEQARIALQDLPALDSTLGDMVNSGILEPTPAQVADWRAERIGRIGEYLKNARQEVIEGVRTCLPGAVRQIDIVPSIVLRTCEPASIRAGESCERLEGPNRRAVEGRARVFGQIVEWMQGSAPALPSRVTIQRDSADPGLEAPLVADTTVQWNEPDQDLVRRRFEAWVDEVRRRKSGIDYTVPRSIGLTVDSASRVLDVLDAPIEAIRPLTIGIQPFSSLSDEVARSRILECSRLRGLADAESIGKCAGYKLDLKAVGACMNGMRCFPEYSEYGLATVVSVTEKKLLKELATASPLARVLSTQQTVADYEIAARQCAEQFRDVGSDEKYAAAASNCLLMSGMASADDKALLSCVTEATPGDASAVFGCISKTLPVDQRAMVDCVRQRSAGDDLGMFLCGAEDVVDPRVAQCINTYQHDGEQSSVSACLTSFVPGSVQHVPGCLQASGASRKEVSMCLASPYLPRRVSEALSCGQQHGANWKAVAACSLRDDIAGTIGGDAGKVASCAIQSGGDYVGTAVCMFGGRLNQTQQIVVQCATTSVDAMSFAICAGGQLALAEFMQCKKARFGQDQCFGRNNEIRRFFRNIGLGDMDENHPVSRVMNVYLNVIKFQVAFAEDAIKFVAKAGKQILIAGGDVLRATAHVIENVAEIGGDLVRVGSDTVEGAIGAINDVVSKGEKAAKRVVSAPCDLFGC